MTRTCGTRLENCRKALCHRRFEGPSGAIVDVYSDFCKHHTCHAYNPRNGKFCKVSVENKVTYCPRHMTCNYPGCREHPDLPKHRNDGIPPDVRPHPDHDFFCDRHNKGQYIQVYEVPEMARVPPSAPMPPYSQPPPFPTPSTAGPYPPFSEPQFREEQPPAQCDAPDCPNFAERKSDYCARHSGFVPCDINDCYDEAQTGPDAGQQLCVRHTCKRQGCQMFKVPNAEACSAHVCEVKGCPNLHRKGTYCVSHVCKVSKCARLMGPAGLCLAHKCKMKSCENAAVIVGGYCHDRGHGCSEAGCAQQSVTADLGGDEPDRCREHFRLSQERKQAKAEADAKEQGAAEATAAAKREFEEQERRRQEAEAAERRAFFNPPAASNGGDSGVYVSSPPSPDRRGRKHREHRYHHGGSNASFTRSDDGGLRTTYVHCSNGGRAHRHNGSQYMHRSDGSRYYAAPQTPLEPMFPQGGPYGRSPPSPRYRDRRSPQMRAQNDYTEQPFFDYDRGDEDWAPRQEEIPPPQQPRYGMPHHPQQQQQYGADPYSHVPSQAWPPNDQRHQYYGRHH